VAESNKRQLTWGTAILAAFLVFFTLIIIYGVAPSQFITTVNKSYGKVPNSRQSRFTRDAVSGGYHVVISAWLIVGAYHIQLLSKRLVRLVATTVLLVLPCVVLGLIPAVLHGFINAFVSHQAVTDRPGVLYDADLWVYTGYWASTVGLFLLLTPGWIFGWKRLEERTTGKGRTTVRQSAFGRPVVPAS
jgi:hypothetical protein